jgi:hypothetical protein
MECNYCKKLFKNLSSLNYHIKNAKYCLKLRDENFEGNFKCNNCLKNFSSKQTKDVHESKCKENTNDIFNENIILKERLKLQEEAVKKQEEKHETQIKELQTQIKELQSQIERLATAAINKPTNVQNNNQRVNQIINNLTPITEQYLKDQAEFLTIDHIKDGVNGYIKYALDYPLKDKIVCTDFSRRKIKYKDDNGNLIEDPEMIKLSQKLFKAIEEKNSTLINEYITELHDKYKVMVMEPNNEMDEGESEEFSIKFNSITDELFKVKNQRKEINEIANGKKTDILHDFIKDVCSKTVN